MVQPTFIQDIAVRTSALEEGRQGSFQLAQILGPVAIPPPLDYSGQSPYSTVYNLQLVNARLEPMGDRLIQAVLAAQTMWQMIPDWFYDRETGSAVWRAAGEADPRPNATVSVSNAFDANRRGLRITDGPVQSGDVEVDHTHQVIDPTVYVDTAAYVQAAFAEPNGGYFALVEPVRAGRGSFWVITGFILRSAITPNPTTPD